MEYYVDIADIDVVRAVNEYYPIDGFTTNPNILAQAKRPLPELISGVKGGHVAFMIGAEGGFLSAEADAAAERGIPLAGLGKRILRCETASGFVLSCLAYETELRGGPESR